MTLNKSQIAKALSIAIVGSSIALMGCEKAETTSESTTVEAPQLKTKYFINTNLFKTSVKFDLLWIGEVLAA